MSVARYYPCLGKGFRFETQAHQWFLYCKRCDTWLKLEIKIYDTTYIVFAGERPRH